MSALRTIKHNERVRAFFREELELTDDQLEARIQAYLEIFPFLAIDFTLNAENFSEELLLERFQKRLPAYRDALRTLREKGEMGEISLRSDG